MTTKANTIGLQIRLENAKAIQIKEFNRIKIGKQIIVPIKPIKIPKKM